MALKTITYSDNADGWTSFWDYYPDWMIGLGNVFYSWKDGNLYKQNCKFRTTNSNIPVNRTYFYSVQYSAIIKTIFNEESASTKMFKTLSLDATSPWAATMLTDLDNGSIQSNEYVEKEGGWYSYIRASSFLSNSNSLLSTQGVGNTVPFNVAGTTAIFPFAIDTKLGFGDLVYFNNSLVGTIASSTITTITVTGVGFPAGVGYVYIVKNSIAESFGLRGYYMEVELSVQSGIEVELFSVSSSLFKSYM